MLVEAAAAILDSGLRALRREVEAYPEERQIWQQVTGLPNSAGTLVLHLAGNLQHYIGATWGETGYVRDRPAEFARSDVPREALVREIDTARTAVASALSRLDEASLGADYPEAVGGARVQGGEYLVHLLTHFAYHLGQIDAHRRIVTGDSSGVGAVRPAELGSARPSTA